MGPGQWRSNRTHKMLFSSKTGAGGAPLGWGAGQGGRGATGGGGGLTFLMTSVCPPPLQVLPCLRAWVSTNLAPVASWGTEGLGPPKKKFASVAPPEGVLGYTGMIWNILD